MRSRNFSIIAGDSDNEPSLVRHLWNRLVFLQLGCTQESPGDSVEMQGLTQQVQGGA